MLRLTALLCLPVAILLATPAEARKYALLVGVGTYSNLKDVDLRAPANDVAIMGDVVLRLGTAQRDITVLATSVNTRLTRLKSAGQPNRDEADASDKVTIDVASKRRS